MNRKIGINIAIIFFLTLSVLSSYSAFREHTLYKNGIRTEGTVIFMSKNIYPGHIFYRPESPIVQFMTQDGIISSVRDCVECHKIRDKVPVIYDPKNPSNAMVDTGSARFNLVYYLVGSLIGLAFFINLRRKVT